MRDETVLQFVSFRPAELESGQHGKARHGEVLKQLTAGLVDTYSKCSSSFGYSPGFAPKRILTKLSKGVHNNSYDNAEHDYICRVGDCIMDPDGGSYEILERLGSGTFGQVLKVHSSQTNTAVALKIIKNKPGYLEQGSKEVRIMQMLNKDYDPDDEKRIVRVLDSFVYRKHLCVAVELLSINLYDVLKKNGFRGVSMALIRVLTEQLLKALRCLREASVIHCDLKPENVLLCDMKHTRIKLIDFGSACHEKNTVYSYVQSRFYRSPEVLLGLPYTSAIDMWSLGCICAELFLGLPIFPGQSEYDQVCRIVELLGPPPSSMLELGRETRKYFKRVEKPPDSGGSAEGHDGSESDHASDRSADRGVSNLNNSGSSADGGRHAQNDSCADRHSADSKQSTAADSSDNGPWGSHSRLAPLSVQRQSGMSVWRLKTREEYKRDEHKKETVPNKFFNFKSLEQMIEIVPYKNADVHSKHGSYNRRLCLHRFLQGVFQTNPDERWTPEQASQHSFITGEKYNPDWMPPDDTPGKSLIKCALEASAARI